MRVIYRFVLTARSKQFLALVKSSESNEAELERKNEEIELLEASKAEEYNRFMER